MKIKKNNIKLNIDQLHKKTVDNVFLVIFLPDFNFCFSC